MSSSRHVTSQGEAQGSGTLSFGRAFRSNKNAALDDSVSELGKESCVRGPERVERFSVLKAG